MTRRSRFDLDEGNAYDDVSLEKMIRASLNALSDEPDGRWRRKKSNRSKKNAVSPVFDTVIKQIW